MARKKKPTPVTPTSGYIIGDIDLEGRLDGDFYQELYRRFKKVAFRINYKLASDEDWCSNIFFNRVLKFESVYSNWAEVDRIVKSWVMRCDSEEGFWRSFYTISHNAIVDELKSAKFKNEEKVDFVEDEEAFGFTTWDLFTTSHTHSRLAEKIINELGKKRPLISLLRIGEVTYKNCEKLIGLRKNTFYRRRKTFRKELEDMIRKADCKLDDEDVQHVLREIVKDWQTGVFKCQNQ